MYKVIIIAPIEDIPTSLSLQAAYNLKDWCERRGIEYKLLDGLLANEYILDLALDDDYDLISYFGHGVKDSLVGNRILGRVISKKNIDELKGKIIHTMACFSGKELGPLAIQHGVDAFFGAITEMKITFSTDYPYVNDWMNVQTVIPKLLLCGKTAEYAITEYYAEHEKLIKRYNIQATYSESALSALSTTVNNNNNYFLYGNPNAILDPAKKTLKFEILDILENIKQYIPYIAGAGIVGLGLKHLLDGAHAKSK